MFVLCREIREEPPVEAEPELTTSTYNGEDGERYISCYPYQSAEAGDLVFEAGEEVMVVKKDGDWWTGVIGSRTGIFPANYVQLPDNNAAVTNGNVVHQASTAMSAEEARNQADADSEVSQINTQNVTNDAGMQEFRGMTASAVSIRFKRPLIIGLKTAINSFSPQSLRAKKGEVATVIAPYEASSSEQLSLQKGQLVMIRKKTDSGWWEGELQVRTGWHKIILFLKFPLLFRQKDVADKLGGSRQLMLKFLLVVA